MIGGARFRCSLHRTEIGLLERGARVPRIDTLSKIATGLGLRGSTAPSSAESGGYRRRLKQALS
jgi:hypothetical protein